MKTTKKKPYDYGIGVIYGKLCNECSRNKGCKDKGCPIYKWKVKLC